MLLEKIPGGQVFPGRRPWVNLKNPKQEKGGHRSIRVILRRILQMSPLLLIPPLRDSNMPCNFSSLTIFDIVNKSDGLGPGVALSLPCLYNHPLVLIGLLYDKIDPVPGVLPPPLVRPHILPDINQ